MLAILLRDKDARLVRATLSGQAEAFDSLVRQYLPMVHALACAHAGSADADDVTQEAFLLAYHKLDTLQEPQKFAGWLATITRNVARRVAQKRAREIPMDVAPERLAAVSPSVERRELTQLLREHLNRMGDESREVLLLHYFAGQTLSQIARALEISQDAAAKRLQRARHALGEQLLREVSRADLPRPDFDSHRRAICAAIVAAPAAWHASAASASIIAAAGSSGALAVKVIIGAVFAGAAIAGVTLAPLLWSDAVESSADSRLAASPNTVQATRETEPGNTHDGGAPQESPVPELAQGAEERTGPGVLRGRVVDGAGNPVAGVQGFIELVDWEPPETPPAQSFRRYGETDVNGFAELRDLPLGRYGIIVWKGDKADAAMFYLREHRPVEEETLVLKPTFPVSGRVVDPQGAPVAGAWVFPHRYLLYPDEPLPHEMTYPARQQTEANGQFTFPHLPPGSMQFLVEAAGFPGTVSAYIASGVSDAVITLVPGGTIEGKIIDRDTGAAAPNVAVHLRAENEDRRSVRVVSDAKGGFTIGPLAPVSHTIVIDDPVLIIDDPEFAVTPVPGKTIAAEIPVRLGATVFGRVTIRETGEPVVGAQLSMWRDRPHGYRDAESDAAGVYAIQGLEPGTWDLNFNAPKGHAFGADGVQEKQFALSSGARIEHNLSLRQGLTISGRVVDEAGKGVPGAEIRTENRRDYTCQIHDAFSGPDGRFRIPGVPPNSKPDLYAWTPERRSYIQVIEIGSLGSETPEIVLTMPECAEVTGSVSTAGLSILEQFQHRHSIRLKASDERIPDRLERAADMAGNFKLQGIPPGEYELYLKPIGGQRECLVNTIQLAAGQRLELGRIVCTNAGGLSIAGRVMSPDGRPVQGAEVRLQDEFNSSVWSGFDGRFRLTGLEPGLYVIAASHDEYTGQVVEAEAGEDGLSINLELAGRVSGAVKDAETGKPIAQSTVRLASWSSRGSSDYGRNVRRATTGDDGTYVLEDVPGGSGLIAAEAAGYVLFQDRLSLESGGQIDGFDIAMSPARRIEGVVKDSGGSPVEDADVRLYLPDGDEAGKARTDAGGIFVFDNVHPDGGFVQAYAKAFAPNVYPLTSSDIRAGKIVISLGHGGVIQGRILIGDAPPATARVYAWPHFERGVPSVSTPEPQIREDGSYCIENAAPGEYRLLVQASITPKLDKATCRSMERQVIVDAGRATPADFLFDAATGILEGVVQLVDMPQQSIDVSVYPLGNEDSEYLSASTRDGIFRFDTVPAGAVAVRAECRGQRGYYRHCEVLNIVAGAQIQCEIVLRHFEPLTVAVDSLGEGEVCSAYFVPEAFASYIPNPLTRETWDDDFRKLARFSAGTAGFQTETTYTLDQIAPGDYRMIIEEATYDETWNKLSEKPIRQQRVTITGQPGQIVGIERSE